jgi:predicted NUDIX family phosphoesterase
MTQGNEEQVLGLPADHARRALGAVVGFRPATEADLTRLLDPAALEFRPRATAETDETFWQLIPYVVVRHENKLFHYRRGQAGGEVRLRSLRSVGIGGHINPADGVGGDSYRAGLRREIAEEVALPRVLGESLLGLLHDDTTPVGRVHLGVVHLFDVAQPEVLAREAAIAESGFAPPDQLWSERTGFETWSQRVLAHLLGQPHD